MKNTLVRMIYMAMVAFTGSVSMADQVDQADGMETRHSSLIARGVVVEVSGWPTNSIVEATIRITDPMQSGLMGLVTVSAQSNVAAGCNGVPFESEPQSLRGWGMVGREVLFVASRSGGHLNLMRCIEPALWSNEIHRFHGASPDIGSVSNAIEAIESVMHKFAAGQITPAESAAMRANILNQHEWLREQVEESKKQRNEINLIIAEYKAIRAAFVSGDINDTDMKASILELYIRSEPYRDFIRRLAAHDGINVEAVSSPSPHPGHSSSGSSSSGSDLDTRQ